MTSRALLRLLLPSIMTACRQEADWVDGRRQGSVAESLENILLLSFDEGDVNNDGVSMRVP